jgi:hypothetical protein
MNEYLSADAEGDAPPHVFLWVDVAAEGVSAHPWGFGGGVESHGFVAVSEHGGSFGDGGRYGVKFIAAEWESIYSVRSCPGNRFVLGKEYFCLEVERFREWLDASSSAITQ